MVKPHHICFNVADRSYLALIKKDIHSLAQQVQFSASRIAEIDIIVAELTSNLVKYAKEGQLLAKVITEGARTGIELISIDKGPGMSDVSRMLEDGVSTTNTLGHGLGAIKRLSDVFQIHTVKGSGTIILSRIWQNNAVKPRLYPAEVQSVVVPKPGETDCGDAAAYKLTPQSMTLFLGDALGHGTEAGKVVKAAVAAFTDCTATSPSEILKYIHQEVRKTRGLVATVATLDFATRIWSICGVGNIGCRIGNGEQSRTYLPYNGIVGMNIPSSINDQQTTYETGQIIVLCSDGLKSRFELYKTQGIYKYDAAILAAALYKDYARQTDDMSVAVGKINLT